MHGRGAGGGAVCGGGAGAGGQPADALAGRARRRHAVRQGELPLQAQQRKDVGRHTTTTCHYVCSRAMCVSSLPGWTLAPRCPVDIDTICCALLCVVVIEYVQMLNWITRSQGSCWTKVPAKGDHAWQMTAHANKDLRCCRAGGGRLLHPGLQPHRSDRAAGLWHRAHQLRLQAAGVNLLWRWWRPAAAAAAGARRSAGNGAAADGRPESFSGTALAGSR